MILISVNNKTPTIPKLNRPEPVFI